MANTSMAIANEFLRKEGGAGALTQMQLQKLTYISHGWNLAINGTSLVSDEVQAWDYGPVFPRLYEHTKFFGRFPIGRPIRVSDDEVFRFFGKTGSADEYRASLTKQEADVIEHVWRRYGRLSAFELSDLTHQPNTPWFIKRSQGAESRPTIGNDLIKEHYIDLARKVQATRTN